VSSKKTKKKRRRRWIKSLTIPMALLVLLLTVIPAFIRALRIQSSILLDQSLIQSGETSCCTSHITPATITAFRFKCGMFAAASLRIRRFCKFLQRFMKV
jgi:hypothetical protein